MKTLKLILLALLLAFAARAQNQDQYAKAMKDGLGMLDTAKTSEQFLQTANYFERIAGAEQKQWLPQYYAGFCNLMGAVVGTQPNDEKDALYNKALAFAEKAGSIMPENSEIEVLKGYTIFMKMAVDPEHRAFEMIPEANGALEKASVLNPGNPRAYLVRGQDTFYTPEAFGGGKAKAKPLLTLAAEKYAKETTTGFEPSWGKARCEALLKQCE
jgi:tetratricopeptide (TPR) repeat protein